MQFLAETTKKQNRSTPILNRNHGFFNETEPTAIPNQKPLLFHKANLNQTELQKTMSHTHTFIVFCH